MEEFAIQLFELAVKNPIIRGFLESLIIKVVAEIFHRRSIDPEYLAASDSAFRQWSNAKTEEEKDAALGNLRALLSQPG